MMNELIHKVTDIDVGYGLILVVVIVSEGRYRNSPSLFLWNAVKLISLCNKYYL